MVATDTLSVEDLNQMMDYELVCQWCEEDAEYMWRHNDVVHFNCGQCAKENAKTLDELIFEGSIEGWCVTCKTVIDLTKVQFIKI